MTRECKKHESCSIITSMDPSNTSEHHCHCHCHYFTSNPPIIVTTPMSSRNTCRAPTFDPTKLKELKHYFSELEPCFEKPELEMKWRRGKSQSGIWRSMTTSYEGIQRSPVAGWHMSSSRLRSISWISILRWSTGIWHWIWRLWSERDMLLLSYKGIPMPCTCGSPVSNSMLQTIKLIQVSIMRHWERENRDYTGIRPEQF